ncbi:hypothetical protein MN1_030 [Thermus phage MN1]|nr:hypothetical protein MN1_030 [Thermus phage MN1]
MGVAIGTIQTALERRYSKLTVVKDLQTGAPTVSVEYVDGFWQDGRWRTVNVGSLEVSGEAVYVLMGLTPEQLGLETNALGYTLDTAIYGLLTGQIKTRATLQVTVRNPDGLAVPARVTVERDNVTYGAQEGPEVVLDLPALLNATLKVVAPGYLPFEKQYQALVGDIVEEVVLTPEE